MNHEPPTINFAEDLTSVSSLVATGMHIIKSHGGVCMYKRTRGRINKELP